MLCLSVISWWPVLELISFSQILSHFHRRHSTSLYGNSDDDDDDEEDRGVINGRGVGPGQDQPMDVTERVLSPTGLAPPSVPVRHLSADVRLTTAVPVLTILWHANFGCGLMSYALRTYRVSLLWCKLCCLISSNL